MAPGSSITFAAAQTGQMFMGERWTLDLGGQNISNSFIEGASISASTFTAATGSPIFFQCIFDAAVTMAPCVVRESYLGNVTLTAGSAGDFFFNFCMSRVAGTSTPVFDFGAALNASNLSMRHYSGGIEIQNMGAGTGTYNMSLEGQGNLNINANCSATSNVVIRGPFTLTNSASGMTITDDARIDVAQVNSEVDTALTDIHLDHLLAVDYDPASPPGTATALLNELIESDAGVSRFTVNALENGPSGSGASAAAIADAVWDEDIVAAHGTADTAGLVLSEMTKRSVTFSTAAVAGSIVDQIADDGTATYDRTTDSLQAIADSGGGGPTAAQIADQVWDEAQADHVAAGSMGLIASETADILADTNELQGDWANGGRLDLLIDAIKAVTDAIPDSGALTTIDANVDSILADTGTDGVVLSAAQMNSIADHVLRRTWANAEASSDGDTIAFRSLLGAVAKLVNRVAVAGSTLTVYRDDDTTSLGTQAVTTNASADPITEVDTA